jgi:hypothetical protein
LQSTIAILLIAVLAASAVIAQQLVHAKGLTEYITVNTNLQAQSARTEVYQFGDRVYTSQMQSIFSPTTNLKIQLPDGAVETEADIKTCVIAEVSNLQNCATVYHAKKQPEYVTIELYGSQPQPQPQPTGSSQSQTQSSSNENNNALSQSQETTVIICNDGKCNPQ